MIRTPFAATGLANANAGSLFFKLHALEEGKPRSTASAPTQPGVIRGVNLGLARYRIDSARLMGMTLVRDTLLDAVKQLDVRGGPKWAAERLIGRVRYLMQTHDPDLKLTDGLHNLAAALEPHRDSWVNDGPFMGDEHFPIRSLLDDIDVMRGGWLIRA